MKVNFIPSYSSEFLLSFLCSSRVDFVLFFCFFFYIHVEIFCSNEGNESVKEHNGIF